jgi:hypothetical protein
MISGTRRRANNRPKSPPSVKRKRYSHHSNADPTTTHFEEYRFREFRQNSPITVNSLGNAEGGRRRKTYKRRR